MFYPKPHIWLNEYDPLYVLLRAVHRRDYQSSVDRFTQFIRSSNNRSDDLNDQNQRKQLWPPFRLPTFINSKFADPKKLLYSKVLHGVIFTVLYRALYTNEVTEQILSLTMFLLQLSLINNKPDNDSPAVKLNSVEFAEEEVDDLAFDEWFNSIWVLENMNIIIQDVVVYEKRVVNKSNRILFGEKLNDNQSSDNNLDQGLSVEEMEVDFLFDNEENPYNFNEGEYMSERREFIEKIEEMQQLPSSIAPLALTSGNFTSSSSTDNSPSDNTPGIAIQEAEMLNHDSNLVASATTVSPSTSSSNSLSSSSSAPLLAIPLVASPSSSSPSTAIATYSTSISNDNTLINNNQNTQNVVSLYEPQQLATTNNSSIIFNDDPQQQQSSSSSSASSKATNAIKMARRKLRLKALSISQNKLNNGEASNWVSGPSTSPQTRTIIPEVPKSSTQNNNWVNSFNALTSSSLVLSGNNNQTNSPTTAISLSPAPSTSNTSNNAISTSTNTVSNNTSLPFLRRFHSQNRRSKLNRRRCPIEFSKQFNFSSGNKFDQNQIQASENQMNIYDLFKALPNNSNNLMKRKITIYESLISLLLKLHSKLSDKQDSYQFDENRKIDINNRIGDATHFIEQILDLYCSLNASTGKQAIQHWKTKLWPSNYAKQENLDPSLDNDGGMKPSTSPSSAYPSSSLETDSTNLGLIFFIF